MPALHYHFCPRQLDWPAHVPGKPLSVKLINDGPDDLWVSLDGAQISGSAFFIWTELRNIRLKKGEWVIVTVTPPDGDTAGAQTRVDLPFRINDGFGTQSVVLLPCRTGVVGKVLYGELAIRQILANPPGNDLDNEGEFLELENLSARVLDLTGSTIDQELNPGTRKASQQQLVGFATDVNRRDFGATCQLPAGATLKVLTRPMRGQDAFDPLRYYVGRKQPVWNNIGDRAWVFNDQHVLVASLGYGSQRDSAPNLPTPTTPVEPQQPPPQGIVFQATVSVRADSPTFLDVFELEDGDTVTLTTDEDTIAALFVNADVLQPGTAGYFPFSPEFLPSGARLLILPRRIEASVENGKTMDTAPLGALLGLIGTGHSDSHFLIGAGTKFVANLDRPKMLALGVNDDTAWDNRGAYLVTVRVER